jgi:hypothetical protein
MSHFYYRPRRQRWHNLRRPILTREIHHANFDPHHHFNRNSILIGGVRAAA